MAEPVRARLLSDQEGQRLTQIVRRGRGESIRVRRAMMIMASASGTPVPAIARLVAADEDTVRDVIHAFNEKGLACLDPKWAGTAPADPARARDHLPAHPDLEGIPGPGQGSQAGSDRVRHQPLPRAVLRLRPVRTAFDPALPRIGVGAAVASGPAAGDLPPHSWHPLLPRLLLPGR